MYRGRMNKLDYLMAAFDVSGKGLATVLHVDYTLVSKWRNNSRQLTSRSSHLKRVAAYFLSLDEPPRHPLIRDLLRETTGQIDSLSDEDLLRRFALWLSDPRVSSSSEQQPVVFDRDGKHYTARFDVYLGNQGRRQAVNRFLDNALALPAGQQLLLHSQEEMSWLAEDAGFLQSWRQKLAAIIAKGDRITIIHALNRHTADIAPVAAQWLPLHMSGRTESYFNPRYRDEPLKRTSFIIKGVAAITGMAAEAARSPSYTAYFTDQQTVQNQEQLFQATLATCRPLLTPFPATPADALLERLIKSTERPYDVTIFSPLPDFTTMPEQTLLALLRENAVAPELVAICQRFHRAMQRPLSPNERGYRVRYICDLPALEELLQGHHRPDPFLSLIINRDLHVSKLEVKCHLQRVVHLLQTESNLELGLVSRNRPSHLPGISIWMKENEAVGAIAPQPGQAEQFAILAEEPTVVRSFSQYLQGIWESIAHVDREKTEVIARLTRVISAL